MKRSETYVDGIIERPVLSDRDNDRLVVRGRVDGRQFVGTSRKAVRYLGS